VPRGGVDRGRLACRVRCGHGGSRLPYRVGGRGWPAAYQVAGERGGRPADQGDDQRADDEVDDFVAKAVADGAADGEAAVLVGWAAATEDGDRHGGVEQLQQPGAERGQSGDAPPRDRVTAPQGTGDADDGGDREDGHSPVPAG